MIRSTATKFADVLIRFHRDEQGAEGLEKLLIVAAVVLPLLGVLMYYKEQIKTMIAGSWATTGDAAAQSGAPVAP